MFKNKKDLKLNVINEYCSLLKNKEPMKIIYTELKNNSKVYEEYCLIFIEQSENFYYHYFSAEKSNGSINATTADFGLMHNIKIEEIDKINNEKAILMAKNFLKQRIFKKLNKKLSIRNIKEKKHKL